MKQVVSALVFAVVSAMANQGSAMKVAIPDKVSYHDAAKKVTLTLFKDARPKLATKDEKHTWPERLLPPSEMLISVSAKTVVFLGGLGDSGMSLGKIDLYDFAGKKLATIDLQNDIADLESLSSSFREKMGNFPWIAAAKLTDDDAKAVIAVCDAYEVTVDLNEASSRGRQALTREH